MSRIGETIGNYRIIDEIGSGGMGVVYRAQDLTLGRHVALKLLPAAAAGDNDAVERFRREARTASSLNHPNICTIFSFAEQDGQLLLAMELLEGEPLDRKLSGKPLDLRTLIDLATQIAEALDAAHGEGILHRDIKPANIFLTRRGQVKVLDFGLAKLAPEAGRKRRSRHSRATEHFSSMTGTTVGTISYMSPEQARGEDLDPRTDLFSFGVVLYEMATGRQSFPGSTTAVIFDGILNRDPAPPRSLNTAVPAELERIIDKALEKDRALRYQSAADMRADLQRLKRDSASGRVPVHAERDTAKTVTMPTLSADPALAAAVPAGSSSAARLRDEALAGYVRSTSDTELLTAQRGRTPLTGTKVALVLGVMAFVAVLATLATFFVAARWALTTSSTQTSSLPVQAPALPVSNATGTSATSALATKPVAPAPPDVAPGRPAPKGAGSAASAPDAGARARGKSADAAAAERLDIARAKIASDLLEPALGDLRQILMDFPGSPAAVEASLLSADVLERVGKLDDAMAARVEFNKRFANDRRAADSLLRLAELTARSRRPDPDLAARDVLGEVVRQHPRTTQAFQALQRKIRIETDRRQLREFDPSIGAEVPAIAVTLRTLVEQFPTSPASMLALNRLALIYIDLNQFDRAAQALTDVATRFPTGPNDAWFRLGELYERRLKDPAKARAAYAKVPADSPRYKDAQRRLNR